MESRHILGRYKGEEGGPLFICTAGMHGNEPAGVLALKSVVHLLEREPLINPGFKYRGCMLALLGNTRAYRNGKQRFIAKDLNRLWEPETMQRIRQTPPDQLEAEELELLELITLIDGEVAACKPQRIVLLDLHSTSARGGIFSIATDAPESVRIAVELNAPVITGLLKGIKGTTLHYFTKDHFPCPAVAVAFEGGQHDDHLSVNRCMAAIINCMRSIGAVRPEDVENRHDELLIEFSKDLPKIAELISVHSIKQDDYFRMRPGYQNFQAVGKGEILAEDRHGIIRSPADSLILMPLYQPQGSDGFFLIKKTA
jgi:succinylglutamate desuccinylase